MFGHPKGLAILFFTEMWERFSYYGMRAILVLFLVDSVQNQGYGWTETEALSLYGWYTMLVYFMSVPGGIIADRYLGQKKTVMLGGALLVIGHCLLAYTEQWAFYAGLGFIICGVGGLKPNISTMVGGLYEQKDSRRDSGFTLFYMGINIGAFFGSLLVGYVGEVYGWHYGFGIAGIGMLLGQAVFVWGQKYLTEVGNLEVKTADNKKIDFSNFTEQEKDRILVLIISFAIIFVFWLAYEQAGGLMNLYTKDYTDRNFFGKEIPTSMFQSLAPAFILIFGGVVGAIWIYLAKTGKHYSSIFKMAFGTIIMGLGFVFMLGSAMQVKLAESGEIIQKGGLYWVVLAYMFHTIGELCLSPVVLAFITRVSPPKIVASMMGLYWAVFGISNKVAAEVGKLATDLGANTVFGGLAVFSIFMGLAMILFDKKLKKLSHGADDLSQNTH
ncbi:MAG: MFS transporter [Bacteroidetes bacterium]|nr:MAG: MFS transporter [Bacteroidota bacterium]